MTAALTNMELSVSAEEIKGINSNNHACILDSGDIGNNESQTLQNGLENMGKTRKKSNRNDPPYSFTNILKTVATYVAFFALVSVALILIFADVYPPVQNSLENKILAFRCGHCTGASFKVVINNLHQV